jgi:Phage derived protein Gp49-like (DUF891)
MWTFLWYPDGTDDPWATWYWQQNEDVQARHDRVVATLQERERDQWRPPFSKKLTGHDGLIEIIIKTRVEHRLLGTFQPNKRFLVALTCIHKGRNYTPKNAFNTAKKRIMEIDRGEKIAQTCTPPGETQSFVKQSLSRQFH